MYMDDLKRKYTNDTLEEELREQLCDSLKEIHRLRTDNEILKETVKLECAEKYRAYDRIVQLTSRTQS